MTKKKTWLGGGNKEVEKGKVYFNSQAKRRTMSILFSSTGS